MAIQFDANTQTFTISTRNTTYQMQISSVGHLRHLYYGKRTEGDCLDYQFILTDCGFSPNSYEARYRRDVSMDLQPQEYSSSNTGDFRVPALQCTCENGAVGTDLRYLRHEIRSGKYAITGMPAAFAKDGEAETLSVTLGDAATGLEVELLYGVFDEGDMLTRAVRITNCGKSSVRLDKAASLTLDIPFGNWELLHFHGRHCMERMPERVPLMHGIQSVASRRGASSHHHNPFVILLDEQANEDSGECLGVMPVYSGNHRTDIEVDQAGSTRVVSGLNINMFSWKLDPGETFETPEVILCWTDGGLSDLTQHYHRFIREHIIRSTWNHKRRPVLINNWEATMFDFTAEKIESFAKEAANLGVEMMVLDDGWFGARNSDNAGLGDWVVNEQKLPGGLSPLIGKINALGLRFGIWIEPEMVNEDSDLYRAHPEWALTVPDRKPTMGRNQLVLDMGNNAVVDYLYGMFSKLLRENHIDYIKWDMNRNMTDVYSRVLPPDRQGEASHRYILGVYDLMERLTSEFPDVLFEGCAGGGGRFDAGILYYMPQIWTSDDSDAIERLTIQYGTSFGYPISTMGAHVSVCPNQQTGRTTPFGTRAVVAMSGTFGYELDPNHLTESEKEQVREQIARFDRYYDLIQNGRYFRLSDPQGKQDYSAWEFAAEDGSSALVNMVMTHTRANPHGVHLRLKGLDPKAKYRLTDVHFDGCRAVLESIHMNEEAQRNHIFSGSSLMYAGYTLPLMHGDYPCVQLCFTKLSD